MKRYVVALEKEERDELAGITRKGSHQSQKVINALILLNCDEGEFNEHRARGEAIAEVLRISARKVDRVKKRFVEEDMEAALGGRQGRRPSYVRKADGEFEARLVALSCAEPPEGHSQWSLRLLADRVVELGHIDSVSHETVRRVLKKRNQAVAARRLGDSPTRQRGLRSGDGAGSRCLPAFLRCGLSGGVHGRDAPATDQRDARTGSGGTGSARARRLRVPTLRKLQRVHGDGTLGRAAHDQGDGAQNQN